MDKLDVILSMQNELNAKYGISLEHAKDLPIDQRADWIRRYCEAAICEISEILTEAGVRWWRDSNCDLNKVQEEAIDLLHFTLSLLLVSGMNSTEIYEAYLRKNQKNNVRKDWSRNK